MIHFYENVLNLLNAKYREIKLKKKCQRIEKHEVF